MALYVPAGARTLRLVLAAVGGLAVGLLLGYVAGRASSPGLEDQLTEVQDLAAGAASALQRLPIVYEQAVAGEGRESPATTIEAVDRARRQLDDAYDEAIWLGPNARDATDAAFDAVADGAADEVAPAEFDALVDEAVATIEQTFALAR